MTRVIKKYPNRRLYDTDASRYITLVDIRDLVIQECSFQVIDKSTGADITRSILLQVISEQEQQGDPIMSAPFLEQVIRAHGTDAPDFLARHLERSLTAFLTQQNQVIGHVKQAVDKETDPRVSDARKKAG